MNLFVTQEAEQDLEQIEEYIGNDNPVAALNFIDRLTARFEQLADHPLSGRERPEYGPDLRSVAEGDYVIVYRVRAHRLEILRVMHGARDIKNIVESGKE